MRLPKHRLFDYNAEGPGVSKDEPPKKGFALFWDILVRRFWKMISLNAMYSLFSVPGLIIMWFLIYTVLTLITSDAMVNDTTGNVLTEITYLTTSLTIIFYALFGGGAATSGMVYVLRNYRQDTHSWLWSDYISTYGKYFVKSTLVFIIDLVMLLVLGVNFWFYGMMANGNIIAFLLQGLMVVIFLIFLLMHAYIYTILVTYEEKSIWEIYKCSFLLAMGKLPTTFLSVMLCAILCSAISILCFGLIYAIIIVGVILFALSSYINLFITYPIVEKYLGKSSRYN